MAERTSLMQFLSNAPGKNFFNVDSFKCWNDEISVLVVTVKQKMVTMAIKNINRKKLL
jgi:hypothetical protein